MSNSNLTAFAVLNSDYSLIFYKNTDYLDVNDGIATNGSYEYNGKTATAIYTGFETKSYIPESTIPWYSSRESITSVIFVDEIEPISTAYWFYEMTNLTSCDLSNLDTSNVTSMDHMFYNCTKLTSLDVSGFDTSKVTDMSSMFHGCSGLTSLNVGKFDTSNVTKMDSMFSSCSGLTTLDVSGFDTSNVTSMNYMFNSIANLTTIYASELFVTTKVTSSEYMFNYSNSLVGEAGTTYNSRYIDATYARIDGGPNSDTPGYFSSRSSIFNAFRRMWNYSNLKFSKKDHEHTDYATISSVSNLRDQIDTLSDSMLRKVELTQAEYDALTEKDPSVIYIITDEEDSNFIAEDQKGVAGGVATLDASGKVPSAQLPSMDYVPNSNKGVANGVATLGSDGKVPESQLPAMGGHYVGTSAPSNTNLLWINSSNNTINYYTGSGWKSIGAVFG